MASETRNHCRPSRSDLELGPAIPQDLVIQMGAVVPVTRGKGGKSKVWTALFFQTRFPALAFKKQLFSVSMLHFDHFDAPACPPLVPQRAGWRNHAVLGGAFATGAFTFGCCIRM